MDITSLQPASLGVDPLPMAPSVKLIIDRVMNTNEFVLN